MRIKEYKHKYPIIYNLLHENAEHFSPRTYIKSEVDELDINRAFSWSSAKHYPTTGRVKVWSSLQIGEIDSLRESNPELFKIPEKGDLIIKTNGIWET